MKKKKKKEVYFSKSFSDWLLATRIDFFHAQEVDPPQACLVSMKKIIHKNWRTPIIILFFTTDHIPDCIFSQYALGCSYGVLIRTKFHVLKMKNKKKSFWFHRVHVFEFYDTQNLI